MSFKPSTIDPPRFRPPSLSGSLTLVVVVGFLVWSVYRTEFSLTSLWEGIPEVVRIVGEMSPPDLGRIGSLSMALLDTFQMAFIGAALGIVGSFFLSLGAARGLVVGPWVNGLCRGVISFFRTVPDLVWAILFVVSVGLGPMAGILTIMVDTMGFCGRFFAEAMEETDPAPSRALEALGAPRVAVVFASVIPAALPSFINSGLYSLEKAVRASVVLGLVGAGGIGIELKAAMEMFAYREAATVILLIFALVLVVEKLSSLARRRFLT